MAGNWLAGLQGRMGKVVALAVLMCGVVALYWSLHGSSNPVADLSRGRIFIDSENLKSFKKTVEIGDSIPVISPFTGKATGYEAELCYWTADGKVKDEPTPVLLNEVRGIREPTFCPDCGRLVVGHNPVARAGMRPPPTRQEFFARSGG